MHRRTGRLTDSATTQVQIQHLPYPRISGAHGGASPTDPKLQDLHDTEQQDIQEDPGTDSVLIM